MEEVGATLGAEAIQLAQKADILVYYMGLDEISESEGLDRSHLSLPQNQLYLLDKLREVTDQIVVVLSAGSVVDMAWDEKVPAVLHGYLSGEAGAPAMLDVLTGRINPSGKLSETYPHHLADIPSSREFPAKGDYALYREGLYVGYRYFDTARVGVKYPYGYGLSYTQFAYSQLEVTQTGVRLTVTNTGQQAGAEVVQLYVGKDQAVVFRPQKELKGFAKIFLELGQS